MIWSSQHGLQRAKGAQFPFGKAGSAHVVCDGFGETFDTVLLHLYSHVGDTWADSWVENWLSFPNPSGGEPCQVQLGDGSVLLHDCRHELDAGRGLLAS